MTTLVTGAGLLGSAFAEVARKRGENIVFFDSEPRADYLKLRLGESGYKLVRGDVRSLPELIEAIKAHGVSTVVHTAGLIGSRVQREIATAFDYNITGTRNVGEAVRLTGVKRLVHLSSYSAYDWRRASGEMLREEFPLGPDRAYGSFKAAKEMVLQAYAAQFKFELAMLRPAYVFGHGHFWAGSSGGAKMNELMMAGITGKRARLVAADVVDAEFIYEKDVGAAIDKAATVAELKDQTFNVGTGLVVSFDDMMAAMRNVFPALQVDIEYGPKPASRSEALDISRAKSQFGWSPKFSLLDAIKDYRDALVAAGAGSARR